MTGVALLRQTVGGENDHQIRHSEQPACYGYRGC